MGVSVQNSGFRAFRHVHGINWSSPEEAKKALLPNLNGFTKNVNMSGKGILATPRYTIKYVSPQVNKSKANELAVILDRKVSKLERLFDPKRAEAKATVKQSKAFIDSAENLQKIADSITRASGGGKHSGGQRSKPTQVERKIQIEGNEYATKQGVLALPVDKNGYPDNIYMLYEIILGFVEWKQPGKQPERKQAKRILELRKAGYDVRVFSDVKPFKTWLRNVLA